MRGLLKAAGVLFVVSFAGSARAQTAIPLTVSGNEAKGSFELPGGIGGDLTLTFEQVVGLSPASLQATATLVDPFDPSLLSQLPDPASMSIPVSFPVLILVQPPPSSALSFSGVLTVSVHTHNLSQDPAAPLSLLWASAGGPFGDRTAFEGSGSHRAGATGPGLSAFLIVVDVRPIDGVIVGKFDLLQSHLTQYGSAMPAAVRNDLQARLDRARSLYEVGSLNSALAELAGFQAVVKEHSGTDIPDVWRAHDSRVNVAGLLRSDAETLKFSLNRKAGPSP